MSFKPVFSAMLATAAWLSASSAAAVVVTPPPAVVLTPGTATYTNVTPANETALSPSTRNLTILGAYSSTV